MAVGSGKIASAPSLFWRTFVLVMLLIVFCTMGWLQSFRVLNEGPYALSAAQQIVSMANLTHYALVSADPVYRPDLLYILATREGLRILPKEEGDHIKPLDQQYRYTSSFADIEAIVHSELGPDTVLATEVNGEKGLWVSISIDGDNYWLMTSATLLNPPYGTTWIWWALAALAASILGASFLTQRLTDPLKRLSAAARDFGRGTMPQTLPENSGPEELREVNSSFNRMVLDITHMEKDREMLLAGVSHDLRTPITRLRLEVEIANLPDETRENMVSDLEQMERIVNQFLDYARRNNQPQQGVSLTSTVQNAIFAAHLQIDPGVKLTESIGADVWVCAHPIELSRVVQNLITNALRYGKSDDDLLHISITVKKDKTTAYLIVADEGMGLDMSQAARVMRPFERGDSARGGTNGTGLGLAIVERIVKRSSGTVDLSTTKPHGLTVTIKMPLFDQKADEKKKAEEKKKNEEKKTEDKTNTAIANPTPTPNK